MSQAVKKDSIGRILILGIQHVFAMFGATVLVPAITGMNPAVALLTAGLGTIIFHICTKGKVPTFLGSSFAFMGSTSVGIIGAATLAAKVAYGPDCFHGVENIIADPRYLEMMPYATGAIMVAGFIYVLMAILVKFVGAKRVLKLFPPIVTGPMVIIIGLMLAPTAISSITAPIMNVPIWQNWLVAVCTIAIIIFVSLFARGFFKLVPILFGIVGGYLIAAAFGMVDLSGLRNAQIVQWPWGAEYLTNGQFVMWPKFYWPCIMMVAPLAIVTFVEHIADVTASSAVVGKNFMEDPGLHRTLLGDGLATMFAGLIGGPANTTYSENTGVLATTKNYNPVTLRVAAVFAILMACQGHLSVLLKSLPGTVTGGVSVVLFGMIASVGLRTLVENQVDFKQTRNLLIASVMLVIGLSGVTLSIPTGSVPIQFSGVALAAVLGIILNLILPEKIEKTA